VGSTGSAFIQQQTFGTMKMELVCQMSNCHLFSKPHHGARYAMPFDLNETVEFSKKMSEIEGASLMKCTHISHRKVCLCYILQEILVQGKACPWMMYVLSWSIFSVRMSTFLHRCSVKFHEHDTTRHDTTRHVTSRHVFLNIFLQTQL